MTFPLEPQGLDIDRLGDLAADLRRDGQARVDTDPSSSAQWIFWLKRNCGFFDVGVISTDRHGLILWGF
jgi:hypothetical protein